MQSNEYESKMSRLYNHISFDELLKNSKVFVEEQLEKESFPTYDNNIEVIAGEDDSKKDIIAKQASLCYPIAHKSVEDLIKEFLKYKINCGNSKEQDVFSEISGVKAMVDRMITNRPLIFINDGNTDCYMLRDCVEEKGSWDLVGTEGYEDVDLKDYMQRDEILISALIGAKCPTFIINTGGRFNKGKKCSDCEEEAVYIGLVGPRFEVKDRAESRLMLVTKNVSTEENGYGNINSDDVTLLNIWAKFYNQKGVFNDIEKELDDNYYLPTYEEVENYISDNDDQSSFLKFNSPIKGEYWYLNVPMYKRRLYLSLLPYFIEADLNGEKAGLEVVCHVVGIGLGVWSINRYNSLAQERLFVEVCEEILEERELQHIGEIHFSWFDEKCNDTSSFERNEKFNGNLNKHITIHFDERNPFEKVADNQMVVASYAWDGNAFPGNEYFSGNLTGSGDPAAICCSTLVELQNPYINTQFNGYNTHFYM